MHPNNAKIKTGIEGKLIEKAQRICLVQLCSIFPYEETQVCCFSTLNNSPQRLCIIKLLYGYFLLWLSSKIKWMVFVWSDPDACYLCLFSYTHSHMTALNDDASLLSFFTEKMVCQITIVKQTLQSNTQFCLCILESPSPALVLTLLETTILKVFHISVHHTLLGIKKVFHANFLCSKDMML